MIFWIGNSCIFFYFPCSTFASKTRLKQQFIATLSSQLGEYRGSLDHEGIYSGSCERNAKQILKQEFGFINWVHKPKSKILPGRLTWVDAKCNTVMKTFTAMTSHT